MRPKLVVQPFGSGLCGQCCIAMAARVTLARAVQTVGHSNGMRTREVKSALQKLGIQSGEHLVRLRGELPSGAAVLKLRHDGARDWHWMYLEDRVIYDPMEMWPGYPPDSSLISYLPLLHFW